MAMATWAGAEAARAASDGDIYGTRARLGHAREVAPYLCDAERSLAGASGRTGEVGLCTAVRVDGPGLVMGLVTSVADVREFPLTTGADLVACVRVSRLSALVLNVWSTTEGMTTEGEMGRRP